MRCRRRNVRLASERTNRASDDFERAPRQRSLTLALPIVALVVISSRHAKNEDRFTAKSQRSGDPGVLHARWRHFRLSGIGALGTCELRTAQDCREEQNRYCGDFEAKSMGGKRRRPRIAKPE